MFYCGPPGRGIGQLDLHFEYLVACRPEDLLIALFDSRSFPRDSCRLKGLASLAFYFLGLLWICLVYRPDLIQRALLLSTGHAVR